MTPQHIMLVVDRMQRENLQSLISSIIEDSRDDLDRARKIYEWITTPSHLTNVYRNYKIDNYIVFLLKPPFICLRLTGEDYPLWVLYTRCGACMEYALLYREIAYAANLTVRSVHNPGEDHNWDEVLIGDKWIIVDASWPIFDPSPNFYEVSRGLNVSFVYAQYPNSNIIDLTERYTNTSLVRVVVLDRNNNLIENATVKFCSLNLNNVEREIRHLEGLTNSDGLCEVKLGGGKYKAKAVKFYGFLGYSAYTQFELAENEIKEVRVVLQEDPIHLVMSPTIELITSQLITIFIGFIWLNSLFLLLEVTLVVLNRFRTLS
ncbi:MAG: transglutaminase domain-containing protein [Candidatus Bathyarchaeia archaeon]